MKLLVQCSASQLDDKS